jgi:hypothetical protein
LKAWEKRVAEVRKARAAIQRLREGGRGADLQTARGSFWGVLNAVIEYVDHEFGSDEARLSRALLGDGMHLKLRAFKLVQEEAKAA